MAFRLHHKRVRVVADLLGVPRKELYEAALAARKKEQ